LKLTSGSTYLQDELFSIKEQGEKQITSWSQLLFLTLTLVLPFLGLALFFIGSA
jgi:hypothetical protein